MMMESDDININSNNNMKAMANRQLRRSAGSQ